MTPQEAIDHLESCRSTRDRIPGLLSMAQFFRKNGQPEDAEALTMVLDLARAQMAAPIAIARPRYGQCKNCAAWNASDPSELYALCLRDPGHPHDYVRDRDSGCWAFLDREVYGVPQRR